MVMVLSSIYGSVMHAFLLVIYFIAEFRTGQSEQFAEQPQSATVSQGQQHTLRCIVQDRLGEVQWLRDGFGLGPGTEFDGYPRYRVQVNDEAGEYHLIISDIQLEDDAEYQCQVGATSESGGLKGVKAKLNVQVPPDEVVLASGATMVEVTEGQPFNLTCRANGGKPAAGITWESPAGRILATNPEDIDFVVQRQADSKKEDAISRLAIVPTKNDEGRQYICSALNPAMLEPMNASVLLHVRYAPELTIQANPSSPLSEGDSVHLSCSSVANPSAVTWNWYRDGVQIVGEHSPSLQLKSVGYELNGKEVACEAANAVGSRRRGLTLNIKYSPRFVSEPESKPADVGDSVTFTCDIQGNPPPTIYWRREGEDKILSTEKSLHLSSITESHFTSFTCSGASNGYDTVSRSVYVLRKGPPMILSSVDQSARYGERAAIECLVRSIPPPDEIFWTRNGENVDLSSSPRYQVHEETVPYGRKSVIIVDAVQDEDFGLYNCSAQNDYGTRYLAVHFAKREVVPLPYVLAGIACGVLLIIVISIVFIVCRRKKIISQSESGSHSSDDDSFDGKKQNNIVADVKVEYSANTVENWHDDMVLPPRYPTIKEYDELQFPVKDSMSPNHYDSNGYRIPSDRYCHSPITDVYAHPASLRNVYDTCPSYPYDPQRDDEREAGGQMPGHEIYSTVTRSKPLQDVWPPPPPSRSLSPTESRLSTNV